MSKRYIYYADSRGLVDTHRNPNEDMGIFGALNRLNEQEAELTALREKVKQADGLAQALDALIKWEIEPTSGLLEEMLEQERKLQAAGLAALADWHKAKG